MNCFHIFTLVCENCRTICQSYTRQTGLQRLDSSLDWNWPPSLPWLYQYLCFNCCNIMVCHGNCITFGYQMVSELALIHILRYPKSDINQLADPYSSVLCKPLPHLSLSPVCNPCLCFYVGLTIDVFVKCLLCFPAVADPEGTSLQPTISLSLLTVGTVTNRLNKT